MNALKYASIDRFRSPANGFSLVKKFSREALYQRHRLSFQQINDFLGEQQNIFLEEEKMNQLMMVGFFLEITTALNKADIWFVAYKGPLLSYRIYMDPTCRRFKDFDFLIKPEAVTKTIDLLHKLGFMPRSFKWPASKVKEKRLLLLLNQYTLDHPLKNISVEIHWNLLKYPAIRQKKMDVIINQNIQQIAFAGQKFNQFSLEFELLHLVIHGSLHTWSRLKWLIDVHEILNRFQIDKEILVKLITLLNAERMVGLCNGMLRQFYPGSPLLPFNYPTPDWFLNFCFHQIMRPFDTPAFLPEDIIVYRWFHIQAFPNWNYKIKKIFLLTVLFLLEQKQRFMPNKKQKVN